MPIFVKADEVEDPTEVARLLKVCHMFKFCTTKDLETLGQHMQRVEYQKGEFIMEEGEAQDFMVVVAEGEVDPFKTVNGKKHKLEELREKTSYGANHLQRRDACHYSVQARSDRVVAYMLAADVLNEHLRAQPQLAMDVVYSLTREIRRQSHLTRTPFLDQVPHTPHSPLMATSMAAGVESFFRSAMNSCINRALTGHPSPFFPHMHVQLPTRILYINGIKGLRGGIDSVIQPKDYSPQFRNYVALAKVCAPGILMTPVSSVLEATNAGHMNPEPLQWRWLRGIEARCVREIIFAVGLNQMSEFCEERVPPQIKEPATRNALGSITAGVLSGYLSHVPHNLSTLKLFSPHKSYWSIFREYCEPSQERIPAHWTSPALRTAGGITLATLMPRGCTVRTTQIVGSFVILNGIIGALKDYSFGFHFNRVNRPALGGSGLGIHSPQELG